MKFISFALLCILAACHSRSLPAAYQETVLADFPKSEDRQLISSLTLATIDRQVTNEKILTGATAESLQKLVSEIQKNGTEDVAKCFIPRHVILFRDNGQTEKFVLVCFECDGIRVSGNAGTPVKSDDVRISQMRQLKTYFPAVR